MKRAIALLLVLASALAVAPGAAHTPVCQGKSEYLYDTAWIRAHYEIHLEECSEAGNMHLELSIRRDGAEPVTHAVDCPTGTVCTAVVTMNHPPLERAYYTISWRYDSDGTHPAKASGSRLERCHSIAVTHGCPFEPLP